VTALADVNYAVSLSRDLAGLQLGSDAWRDDKLASSSAAVATLASTRL